MSLSNLGYADPTFFAFLFPPPAVPFLVKVIESADAADMQAKVQQALDEVIALNVVLTAEFGEDANDVILTLGDADLAGGGDGHTFVCTLYFVPNDFNLMQTTLALGAFAMLPENLLFTFALASDEDSLRQEIPVAITAATGGLDTSVVFQWIRGAAKGTRFMYGLGGIPTEEGPQALDLPEGGGEVDLLTTARLARGTGQQRTGLLAKLYAAKAKADAEKAEAAAAKK